MAALKKELRGVFAKKLAQIPADDVKAQSEAVFQKVVLSTWFTNSKRVSIYVNTAGEVLTDDLVVHALQAGKEVFVPQFLKGVADMKMLRLPSVDEFKSLPATLWGIRQPAVDCGWPTFEDSGPLDLVLMPGVGFSRKMERLGHGKGFYDKFLAGHKEKFGKFPMKVALALNEQIVDELPTRETDVPLDSIISSSCTL